MEEFIFEDVWWLPVGKFCWWFDICFMVIYFGE